MGVYEGIEGGVRGCREVLGGIWACSVVYGIEGGIGFYSQYKGERRYRGV